ncbi:Flagellar motility protein MotE, a chaperone for MotC folding [Anoxybacillus pushchinoensis]|uniref:Flagellar motility protein MotE, a chaperone for MotC folding n=1 Tax=Anoxybacillus pushchinoensis TaxID=150248 RepID=A0A1I0SHN2_9BACL|nr:MotE family protein [Anoxybacillus pushchinoensis]SFA38256.1 Flagellar motility protein MotE, a chaperone for MotC folding [Anoxybacillus pushchinoensis]
MEQFGKDEETKKTSKLQWFLFVVFIPLLFTISIVLLVLTFSGINVFEQGKKYAAQLPFISQWVEGTEANEKKKLQEQLVELKATIVEKEKQLKEANDAIKEKEAEIDALQQEIARLQAEKEQVQEPTTTPPAEQTSTPRVDVVKMYETMSPRKAAEIIPQMSDQEAVNLLSKLKTDKVAAILEKMDAQNAAKYTSLLAKKADN